MRLIKAFKESSTHTKIFWIVALGIGIISTAMCFYPYYWLDQHRSVKQEEKNK